jgi:hypothetical protein
LVPMRCTEKTGEGPGHMEVMLGFDVPHGEIIPVVV